MSDRKQNGSAALGILKDFQHRTVQHAFKRLYKARNSSRRFLVADEVGLGKTMVARGIVAKAIAHLESDGAVDRIDIVYVCSNAAIAQQNVNRLNVTGQREHALATRLTLLPLELSNLGERKVNFVSFTPGTTFDLKHSTGVVRERLLLHRILRDLPGLDGSGLRNLLQCDVGRKKWRRKLLEPLQYDRALVNRFLSSLRRDRSATVELAVLCDAFHRHRESWPKQLKVRRNSLIARLRKLLAKACVDALEPDLVILDEFQRFKDLLSDESEAGELAQELMSYPGVRVLLLSATPYKMLTLYGEEEDHYEDFLQTLRFLYRNDRTVEKVRRDLSFYRAALCESGNGGVTIRDRLQRRLRKVMVRTERIASTKDRDAMVHEPPVPTSLLPQDLHRARALDNLVRAIGADEALEYWKSAPYLLNFMKGYKLKELFADHIARSMDLPGPLSEMSSHLISEDRLKNYGEIDPGNARLRAFVERTLGNEEWRLLWLPPSMPYTTNTSHHHLSKLTKSLVFSTWSVVPDVIAAVGSYIAERQRVRCAAPVEYSKLHEIRKALLVFRRTDDRLESMSTLLMLYPSPTLAKRFDPLKIAMEKSGPVSLETMREAAFQVGEEVMRWVPRLRRNRDMRADQSWHWAALARVDARKTPHVLDWLHSESGLSALTEREAHAGEASLFKAHADQFANAAAGEIEVGGMPEDLSTVWADLAIGSPAICANRALRRIAPELAADSPEILSGAAHVAEGFRSFFNSPDVRSLIETEDLPYWRKVLRFCAEHELQAVLDEYVHVLKESLGLLEVSPAKRVADVATAIRRVLSIRTSNLEMDEIRIDEGEVTVKKHKMRCRYALRFGDLKDDSDKVLQRAGAVRDAFNSPFRPFILASTSVGQEGLDFHSYCHRVWHWNLPRNPVDMEQREGRVNRYKNHAVRRNVARAIGIVGLAENWNGRGDPWNALFKAAKRRLRRNGSSGNDLIPFWIFEECEDASKVERMVPLPPFSSEISRYKGLKRSLAIYRLAFGQPRQEDLIEYLCELEKIGDGKALREMQLNLAP